MIGLQRYNGFPDRPVAFTRRNVYRRDGHRCVYCGDAPPMGDLTIDHVMPRARGGGTSWENCVTACFGCNAKKADRLPHEIGYRMAAKPRPPTWPGGLDPAALRGRPVWDRFIPASHRRIDRQ